ncbi:tRNA (N6-isopentenyl adenosine(37)-C2)-methylthiotransferase MiaB [Candidatus Bipolaricaulota bacterium]|nr:tRNA (N6-isopentenyl adenosine(37)-C2)-methylthiotransferase MiaB [Candidatus Bipolaricaulota bacterium]
MKACILTWGCQQNEHTSEGIAGVLLQAGYRLVDAPEEADVILLNTCMVRGRAEDKVIGRVGELQRLRRIRPVLIGVGGCMAQGRGEGILGLLPGANFAFGTSGLCDLPALIDRAWAGERFVCLPTPNGPERLPILRRSPFQAYVTIAEGCSHACAYCVVPRVRGPLRSRPMGDVLAELRDLSQAGYQEATLLGQNVDAYGHDLGDGTSFARLLRAVRQVPIPRIRFTTSHPAYMTDEVIAVLAEGGNLCSHVHLAVQSGSDRILRAMNRGYTREGFLALVRRLREAIPGVNVTTDVIVGFPGETEEDFALTLSLIDEARFGTVYAAAYSPRPGTRAAGMPDDVPPGEKAHRLARTLAAARRVALDLHRARVGTVAEVLVEAFLREKGCLVGKTRDFRTVLFPGDPAMIGRFAMVTIEEATPGALHGRLGEAG